MAIASETVVGSTRLPRHLYATYEALALSGQMPEADLIRLLDGDVHFTAWWEERMAMRARRSAGLECKL